MTQQQESTGGLNSTGNRVLIAVAVGLLVSFLGRQAGLHGVIDVLVFALVVALTYALITSLRPRR